MGIKKILLLCCMMIFSQNLLANEQIKLQEHFLSKIDKIVSIVKDKNLSATKRNAEIVTLLTPTFDFELMAKLSLGKKWKQVPKKDRQKFIDLYVKRMENSYSSKLDSYSNETVRIKEIKQPKKNRIAIVTDLVTQDKELEIIYKFHKPKRPKKDKDTWLIYDVEILGISILKADKAQFREFLKTKTIDDLMDVLVKS